MAKPRVTDSDERTAEEMVQALRDGDDAAFRRAQDSCFERWYGVEGTMFALASKLSKLDSRTDEPEPAKSRPGTYGKQPKPITTEKENVTVTEQQKQIDSLAAKVEVLRDALKETDNRIDRIVGALEAFADVLEEDPEALA